MNTLSPWNTQYAYEVVSTQNMYEQEPEVDNLVVFVHGNGRDGSDWSPYFETFSEQGVDMNRLWAISFDNSVMTHSALAEQLEDYIDNLFSWTGASSCSVVAHSLGVTVTRVWMEEYDRYDDVESFVGLAGANHGVTACPPKKIASALPVSNRFKPCQFIGSNLFRQPEIEELNETVGETPGDVDYYTIRGTKDVLFTGNVTSPRLEGATNVSVPLGHDELRVHPTVIETVGEWVL